MYAVIRTGGKQYTVKPGDVVKVEKLEKQLGEEFNVDDVLLVSGETSHFGSPAVDKAVVTVVVTQQSKHPKIIVFKKKRRQGYRRLAGHRQPFTELFVKEIVGPNGEKEASSSQPRLIDSAKKFEQKTKAKKTTEEKPVAKKAAAKKTATKKTTAKKKTAKKKAAKKTTTKK